MARLELYTRVRLLNDDHAGDDKLFREGTECWLVRERTLKSSGKWYTLELLDERCDGHWIVVGPNEIEPVEQPKPKPRARAKRR